VITTKQQAVDLLRQNSNEFQKFGVKRIGIFGSFVLGKQDSKSDIDLLVEFDEGKKSFRNFMGTASLAETIFDRKVDLVTPQSLSPHIAPYVEREVEYV
jgi:predicted nucleotidyltransferase